MINKAILIGRLGKDPDQRAMSDGTSVSNFSIATTESYKDRNGDKVQTTEWHSIVAFGKLADICNQYLEKGALVFVEGKLETKSWEDADGVKHTKTSIKIYEMKMLGGKKDGDTQQAPPPDDVPF